MFNEYLYFFLITIRVGFADINEYAEWLNNQFLSDEEHQEILLDLEFCTFDTETTVKTIEYYLFDRISELNFDIIGKLLFGLLKRKCENKTESLVKITEKLYEIWCLLPQEIAENKPFITMNTIDDLWAWKDDTMVNQEVDRLIHYFD